MSYCINPKCPQPNDPANLNNRVCRNCGSELLLQERYQVMRLLSDSSGFGKVYEAYYGAIPKLLKVLKQKHNDKPRIIELFQQEAAVLSQLNHPGTPRVDPDGYFQFFPKNSTEPVHCIIMEKIDGLNLKQWMKQQGNHPISEKQAFNWLKQLAEILHLVHQKNYFHRDIKPENIMIRPNGQLVLIDFGTARELTFTYLADVGGAGSVTKISSAGYTPPEQEKGHAVPQSDFYALGRTFVYLLTGKQATDSAIYEPLTDTCHWRKLALDVSEPFANLIDKLMAPTAAKRHKNTQEILDEIASIYKLPQDAIQPPLGTHLNKDTSIQSYDNLSWVGHKDRAFKKRWLMGGVAALTLMIGGYGIWQLYQNHLPPASLLVNTIVGDGSYINYLVMTPDGKSLLSSSADKKIKLWDFSTGKEIRTLIEASIPINYFALSPDWQTLATGGTGNTIAIWDFDSGQKIKTLKGHSSYVNYVVISPDGKKLASASADHTIKIWDFSTGKELLTLNEHSSYVNYIAITPDGKKLASASADNTIKIWDLSSGKELLTLTGHSGSVNSLAITPDGRKLASASADNTIKIWDLSSGKELFTLTGHSSPVKPLAITPDGNTLVSASADHEIKIWNISTGREIQTIEGHSSSVNSLLITPDGKKLVSASADGTIKIWRMPN
ncbi:serine/threonine-protein kinase [Allocoleopsis franciscana]|uniref:WD40 repeat-containing protein SMU1 n=1 Tax=Allocoleopsis franciscana PCC 7113 TaxID=1173027 RepID=K9WD81_9CYAN|nr:serine/threonine-protein kinase [Allocoleopsis franciscana]AFZ17487.1 WD40 repeat-containing protein [Allocoleopsis franciscana PCC 7113]